LELRNPDEGQKENNTIHLTPAKRNRAFASCFEFLRIFIYIYFGSTDGGIFRKKARQRLATPLAFIEIK
jgi:hypothetical protein